MVDLAKELGEKYLDIGVESSPGVTDASNLLQDKDEDFPFMMFGPGKSKMAHKVDEYVDEYVYKDYYFAFFDIYKELILELTENLA